MDINGLVHILTNEDFTIEVNHSVVTVNGNEIGFCYVEDDSDEEGFEMDSLPIFDLVLGGELVEKFNLDDVSYGEDETLPQLIHTCLTSWVDYMDE
jgi:hypothetical protein